MKKNELINKTLAGLMIAAMTAGVCPTTAFAVRIRNSSTSVCLDLPKKMGIFHYEMDKVQNKSFLFSEA